MNWVKKHKLPAVKAIKYNNCPCLEIDNLWHTLYSIFNLAQTCQINVDILEEILDKPSECWPSFSKEKFIKSITKYNNSSASGPDKLSWSYLKCIINDEVCLEKIISIANMCFVLGLCVMNQRP